MNFRRLALFSLVVVAAPFLAGEEFRRVTIVVPPMARAAVIPLRIPIPARFTGRVKASRAWELVEGPRRYPTQPEDPKGAVLRALLPVVASQQKVSKSMILELVPKMSEQVFQFKESEERYLRLMEGASPILTYNFGMLLKPGVAEDRRRSCYVHPLYSPDGTVLTDDFPTDHFHHRGVSWMWPAVEVGGEKHSLWDIRGISQRFERWLARESGPVYAKLAVENGWYVDERKVARETVEFLVYRVTGEGRAIDVALVFEATDRPVTIAGTQDQQKGYGGFCFRFSPRGETWVTTPAGTLAKDTDREPSAWADLSGRFSDGNRVSGAAIFIEGSHPGYPNGWTLRNYGFLGVAWPGLQAVTLQPGRSVTLKYRLWLHSGDCEGGAVAVQYQSYSNPPAVSFSR